MPVSKRGIATVDPIQWVRKHQSKVWLVYPAGTEVRMGSSDPEYLMERYECKLGLVGAVVKLRVNFQRQFRLNSLYRGRLKHEARYPRFNNC